MPAIDTYAVTSSTAKALRALNKYGMNLADFAALTTGSSFDAFGNGTGYTVSNWVSDGVFASVAAAQAVYPIIQDGNDHVDWVLLQSAVDFMIYGSLGTSNYKNTKRKLFVPAGKFLINRTLHIGYGTMGTPPGDLNGNAYTNITIEGEGRPADSSGNGMTGTTITTEAYTYPGIVVSKNQGGKITGLALQGPGVSWLANNTPIYDADVWDRAAWRDPAIANANWIGGAAVNIGIGFDLYSDATAAAAYPVRILPASFGGGTSAAVSGTAGGTTFEIEDVSVSGFVIGAGRPHGDNNGEFYRLKDVDINYCGHGWVSGHSQSRNNSLINVNFEVMHTCITNVGGLQNNANHHGTYQNIHVGRVYQILDHQNADWSGPVAIDNMYAESFHRIGDWASGRVQFNGGYLSFAEQAGDTGVPCNHGNIGHLIFNNTTLNGLRHGYMSGVADFVSTGKIEVIGTTVTSSNAPVWAGHANETAIAAGADYMRNIFHHVGSNSRRFHSDASIADEGNGNNWLNDTSAMTFLDQKFVNFYAGYPMNGYPIAGSDEMNGSVQTFPVPKISRITQNFNLNSRSGFDIVCDRNAIGDIKADVGDVYALYPNADGALLRYWTWFIVVSISGATMTLRQLSNFESTTSSNYFTNGHAQMVAGSGYAAEYICTRIRQNRILFVGDVTAGSAVISNVRYAFQFGTTDQFTDANFDMTVGDYFLHQEIERSLSTGGVRVHNLVSAIDFTANTITLTQNFNITRNAYPIVFYVRQFNA
jgi:hypothetical protein